MMCQREIPDIYVYFNGCPLLFEGKVGTFPYMYLFWISSTVIVKMGETGENCVVKVVYVGKSH